MKDNYENYAGYGLTNTENALVIPYKDNDTQYGIFFPYAMLCPVREWAIKKSLKEDSNLGGELVTVTEENICVYAYDKGDKRYIFCVNFTDDTYDSLHIQTSEKYQKISVIKVGAEDGVPVDFAYENGEYTTLDIEKIKDSFKRACDY